MALSELELSEIEKLSEENPILKKLFLEWKLFVESPYSGMYLSILKAVNDWNDQIKTNPVDLFASKDIKDFERVSKYFSDTQMYTERLDFLRSKMNPKEIKKSDEEAKTPYERALQMTGDLQQ